jgi:hypothetical protein
VPARAATGDVLLAQVDAALLPGDAITAPAGWTLVRRTDVGGSARLAQAIFVHVRAAGETRGVKLQLGRSAAAAGGVVAYGGIDPAVPVDASSQAVAANATSAAAPALNPAPGGLVVSAFGSASGTNATLSATLAERIDVHSSLSAATGDGGGGGTSATFGSKAAVIAMQIALHASGGGGGGDLLLHEGFDAPNGANGLITNEYAFWNAGQGVASPVWEMDSGSAFSIAPPSGVGGTGNVAWTGVPDTCDRVDEYSRACTNSNVFRLASKRRDLGDISLSVDAWNQRYTVAHPDDWDGVELWLRYQSEYQLYLVKPERYDGHVTIQKKCPGGSDNGGTYFMLFEQSGHAFAFSRWIGLEASARTNADGSVTITVSRDGHTIGQATDAGGSDIYGAHMTCGPITHAGGVGVRGDNDEFYLDDLEVGALH